MLTKAILKKQIDNLPEEFTVEELVESLIFLEKVELGLKDSENGHKISERELDEKMKQWFK